MTEDTSNELSPTPEAAPQADTIQSLPQIANSLKATLDEIEKQKKELRDQGVLVRLGFIVALLALIAVVMALLIDTANSLKSDVDSRETLIRDVQRLNDKIK